MTLAICTLSADQRETRLGEELAVRHHLQNGEELTLPLAQLLEHGKLLFSANWTGQDGGGRPNSKGTGEPLSDPTRPLTGPRAFNRISGPDANSCQGCHNAPYAIAGGGGDVTTNTFETAQRFDFVTFDRQDPGGAARAGDRSARQESLSTVGNARSTPGLFGAGYLEMLARQMTGDLQRTRDAIGPGQSRPLISKGVPFGTLTRRAYGRWVTGAVEGLARASVLTPAGGKPSLVVRPWQSGTAVSLREVTNTLLNRHHGIQSTERFGVNTDPDGDGVRNELTRGDVTAAVVFQSTLAVPGRVIPNDPAIERAVLAGEQIFERIRCTSCHVPALPLDASGWIYSEPGPYNPAGNMGRAGARLLEVNLTDAALPLPRLEPSRDDPAVVRVPAYTDFKLHDITDPTDQNAKDPAGGNRRFLTRRLWGAANEPPYFHHGLFTTMRRAVLAHAGEALEQRQAFEKLAAEDQDALIEFLKSLQVLPPGTRAHVVDERFQPKVWPPRK